MTTALALLLSVASHATPHKPTAQVETLQDRLAGYGASNAEAIRRSLVRR